MDEPGIRMKEQRRESARRIVFEPLERRVLLSADSLLAATDDNIVARETEKESTREANSELIESVLTSPNSAPALPHDGAGSGAAGTTDIVFIDSAVPDALTLLEDLTERHGESLEVVFLNPARDGIGQITDALSERRSIDAIHIISHGTDAAVQLGGSVLDTAALEAQADAVRSWGEALTDDGDLLFYGCDLASSDAGQRLVQGIANLTGADVAASDDPTGAASLGGDWDLEYTTGAIESGVVLSSDAQQAWQGILASTSFQQGDANGYAGTLDTELRESAPTTAQGGNTSINIDLNASPNETEGLIRFDGIFGAGPGQIPEGAQITSASLTVETTGDTSGTISLHRMLTGWDENSTWDAMIGGLATDDVELAASADSQFSSPAIGSTTFTGLENTVQLWANGATNYGWGIISDSANGWDFDSSEGTTAPTLTINYVLAGSQASTAHSLTVDTVVDVEDGDTTSIDALLANRGADGKISLREAIWAANNTANVDASTPDEIDFAIGAPGSLQTIVLSDILPTLTDPVIIDALTQGGGGYSGDPLIELDGGSTANFATAGFRIFTDNSTVSGFILHSFDDEAIEIDADSAYGTASNNTISNNWIGINSLEAAAPNGDHGILIIGGASNNLIKDNVISGNTSNGIEVRQPGTSNNVIQGNIIGLGPDGSTIIANGGHGISIFDQATGTLVGSDGDGINDAAERNVISGNTGSGVSISGAGVTGHTVAGNYIGTDSSGTLARANVNGVWIQSGAASNTIGGTTAGARNVISGNSNDGVRLQGAGTDNNLITGNYIGITKDGDAALGNADDGVSIQSGASNNTVGGTAAGTRNVISGNDATGVYLADATTTGNVIQGNYIGTDSNGTADLGNGKVALEGNLRTFNAGANTIGGTGAGEGNIIAFGGSDGIEVQGTSAGITIRGNAIFSNSGLGIDLASDGVSANDVGDGDTGLPNEMQNHPVITSVVRTETDTTISGRINSTAGTLFNIDFYSSSTEDPSRYGEAETYLGTTTVTTDGVTGDGTFSLVLPSVLASGTFVTATATDPSGNTSEFGTNALSTENVFIATDSAWKYLDDGSDQGTAWQAVGFNDAAWASGAAQLGYGDGDEATTVGYGGDPNNKHATTYFRQSFNVTDASQVTSLTLRLLRDDGAVVYLNGNEVARDNMPGGAITHTTLASSSVGGADESTWYSFTVDPALLVSGTNALAVEVHQSGVTSSDISFNAELIGEVNDAPTGADNTVVTNEDTAHTFAAGEFGFGDVDTGDTLSAVRIDTLPAAGSLTLSGVVVTAGQVILAGDVSAGNLVFTPAADANGAGYASFTFSVRDQSNAFDAAPNTLTVDVTTVNDAPVVTEADSGGSSGGGSENSRSSSAANSHSETVESDAAQDADERFTDLFGDFEPAAAGGGAGSTEPDEAPAEDESDTDSEQQATEQIVDGEDLQQETSIEPQEPAQAGGEPNTSSQPGDSTSNANAANSHADGIAYDNSLMASPKFLDALDIVRSEFGDDMSRDEKYMKWVANGVTASGLSFTAGVVTWAIRGGSLLSTLLAGIPAWKGFDPLPVLLGSTAAKRAKLPKLGLGDDNGNNSLDRLFSADEDSTVPSEPKEGSK